MLSATRSSEPCAGFADGPHAAPYAKRSGDMVAVAAALAATMARPTTIWSRSSGPFLGTPPATSSAAGTVLPFAPFHDLPEEGDEFRPLLRRYDRESRSIDAGHDRHRLEEHAASFVR